MSTPTPAPVSMRERKKRATKQAIYDAAVRRFMDHGYDATTVDDIARDADVSRATFFNYYPTKEAILHAIAADALEYARKTFDREFENKSASIRDKIKRSLERFASIVERNPKYYQTVFLDALRSQAGMVAVNRDAVNNLMSALTQDFSNAQQRGELDRTLDPAQLAEMLTGIYLHTILNYILGGCVGSVVERIGKAAEIFLDGCKARES
jgi:AcrR family transcriptional regulator